MRNFALAVVLFWVVLVCVLFLLGLYMLFVERSVYDSIGCGKCDYEHDTEGHTRFTTFVIWTWHVRKHWGKE